jgi:hypothetical protein
MFIYLNKLFISLVTMDHFCRTNTETDYVAFIESLTGFFNEGPVL